MFEFKLSYKAYLDLFISGRGPIYGPRVMIWTNLNPHVLRIPHVKYQISGTYSSQEEEFW